MTTKKEKKMNFRNIIFTTIFTMAFLTQIILMFTFFNEMNLIILIYVGYIFWGFSLYFGLISFWTFKKRGGVQKGKSYINTTELVEKGPYAIVRHPQYFGGILFTISITLWTQLWVSLILSLTILVLTYQWTYVEDKNLIDKFGEDYKRYKEKVPRLNPILGIIRHYTWKKRGDIPC